MALTTTNTTFKRVGPGSLYLAAAPTADPGTATIASTTDGYYGLFYQDSAAKKALKAGVLPWGNLTNGGMTLKIKPSTVEFDPNNAPKTKMITGIDEATAEFEFFDVDPAHLVDLLGSNAADLIAVAAASGKAGRKIAVVGPTAQNKLYSVLFRMPDPVLSGEFWHYLLPAANLIPDFEIKLSKKDTLQVKVEMSLQGSPFCTNAQGFAPVAFSDMPDAAATA